MPAHVSEDSVEASTAKASSGNEFCLLHTRWKNEGDVASIPVFPGNLIVDAEEVAHEQRDLARSLQATTGTVVPGDAPAR